MSFTAADGRRQLLSELAIAAGRISTALAELTEAYEHVDDDTADRLEEGLFRPVQLALGAAKRTHAEFGARYGLATEALPDAGQVRPTGARAAIEQASDALREADHALATLQDSMLPVEVGDQELRAGLARVRELISPLPARGRELVRTLGR